MKKENGITLVALVISIIVLLILATVTIQTLTGNNGLLTKAETAVQSNKDSQELEKIQLAVLSAQMKNKNLSEEILNTELQETFNNDKTVIESPNYYIYKTDKSYRIYKDGKVEEGNLLPDEFKQVEYIESTGTQYINTLIPPIYNDTFTLEYSHSQVTGTYRSIMGAASDGEDKRIYISDFASSRYFGNRAFSKANPGEKYKYEFTLIKDEKSILKINNTEVISSKITAENLPMMLFARNSYNGKGIGKIYSFIWKRNGNNIMNLIPCYSVTTVTNADNIQVPADSRGLYDLVEGKFYTNANTAEGAVDFTAGPEV